jgi:hypothetical protein
VNKTDILNRIFAVIRVLNNVEVKGKQNLDNLGGSIKLLEETAELLNKDESEEETFQ